LLINSYHFTYGRLVLEIVEKLDVKLLWYLVIGALKMIRISQISRTNSNLGRLVPNINNVTKFGGKILRR